ncbi:MAG: class I SAM-dependent methyltransferase [Flavobacteriales bacterium]|nr:class I SAM-dependent methyltransferase [Flavobacteriales bacterium]
MTYQGTELDLFQHARNWKRYFSGVLRPCVRGQVLDVGCGIGANAEHLVNERVSAYTFLEPDQALLDRVPPFTSQPVLGAAERIHGTTAQLTGRRFDTILYIDVIEHIEDSSAELQRAYALLQPGGHLLILVPAFNFLFSEFDRAIGHFRRYDKRMLRSELPSPLEVIDLRYLDSAGLLPSLANKCLLRQNAPTMGQLRFWDRMVVPCSRVTDKLVLHSFGRSLLCVARKPSADAGDRQG